MTSRAELSSLASGLDELAQRVTRLADSLPMAERDAFGADLYEVERTLVAAQRRLTRIVDTGR
ncbi:MAG: hypothetical protein ACRDXE_06405 [Acidimicrobiales bacterium]